MNYNPYSLHEKTILVTGASSGIGKATAIECSRLGATMIITGRNEERLSDTFHKLNGGNHKMILADLAQESEIDKLIADVPLIDGCVNNAGYIDHILVSLINSQRLKNIFDVNTFAPILITQKLVKHKKFNKGSSIVFTSSLSGPFITYVGSSLYSSTKGAIHGFIKGAAVDLAPKGIRVNSVNPGMIETDILQSGLITDEQIEIDKKRYPMKRYGKPEEVAWMVIYLLSDASVWITGTSMVIDGGYTLL